MSDFLVKCTHGTQTAGLRIPAEVFTNLSVDAPTVEAMRDELRAYIGRWLQAGHHAATQPMVEQELDKITNID